MKKQFWRTMLYALALSATQTARAAVPDSVYVLTYNPGPTGGLQMAWSSNGQDWNKVGGGHNFFKSDFGAWGAQKKMYNPSVIRKPDGLWCCVFQLNHNTNQLGVTYSRDLWQWQPQDYPVIEGVQSCVEPVLSYDATQGLYRVHFKTAQGETYVTTSSDFLHFTPAVKVDASAHRVQATRAVLDNEQVNGNSFKMPFSQVKALDDRATVAGLRWRKTTELARDNESRFAGLKPLEADVVIDAKRTKSISDKLIGIFFEDINYAADGGLYAELIQNRDFEYAVSDTKGSNKDWKEDYAWSLQGDGVTLSFATEHPIHANNPHYAVLDVQQPGGAALQNEGFDGIVVREGEKYKFSMRAKMLEGKGGALKVELVSKGRVVAAATVKAKKNEWTALNTTIKASAAADDAVLRITPQMAGRVAMDLISLFPQNTFKQRENGMRADLAQMLADIKPKFMRFPGGCAVHGDGLHNIYNWKETIGPLESRKPQRNIWGYHQTRGLGYYEYFQLCEDMGCEPLPVLAAGVCCQNSSDRGGGQQGGIPMCDMPAYIQDVLDLIEWANGDAKTTVWGRKRAEQGHPKPFNLKYIGIGNEDLISRIFEERYLMIIKAVKEKYPDIVVCGTSGPFNEGSDYVRGWELADEHRIDMIDEHYYQSPGWFIYNNDFYDHYDRKGSKVYLGEYAAHGPGRKNTIETALCEALHITSLERNGDVVAMSSYAPLLAKEKHTQWNPDMIYFNNTQVKPTVGYYVQKMCGNSSGTEYIDSRINLNEQREDVRCRVGVSTVRDEAAGRVYIKLVNLLNHPVKANLHLDGLVQSKDGQSQKARLTVLTGAYDSTTAQPEERSIDVTPLTDYELPPYSFSLIEL